MADYLIKGETLSDIAEAIRNKTGGKDVISVSEMAAQIESIAVGGGSSEDVRYVTFMSHDGAVELGKKAVAVGDDCADPIARGVFDTPIKESTAQYNYTFVGWATSANGALDETALDAVTEDRTVYAAYAAAVRYYTISYYDGETLLNSETLAYGAMPAYKPTKEGYTFAGWEPAIAMVTGDAEYQAVWLAKVDFASLTWAKIAEYAESGKAADVFEIGAKKTFTSSNSTTVTAEIIGFNHDDLTDGSGKAGITFKVDIPHSNQGPLSPTATNPTSWGDSANTTANNRKSWDESYTRKYWNNDTGGSMILTSTWPSDLVSVIKQVNKKFYDIPNARIEISADKIWLPSMSELGFTAYDELGECYEAYTSDKIVGNLYPELIEYRNGAAVYYRTRSKLVSALKVPSISANGGFDSLDQSSNNVYSFPHFCI